MKKAKGYACTFISALLYGVEPTVVEYAFEHGMTVAAASLMMTAFMLAGFGFTGLLSGVSFCVKPKQLLSLLLLGVLNGGTTMLLEGAYAYIPVGCVTVIHFLYPTLTCMVMVLFFGIKLTVFRAAAMAASLIGLVLVTGGVSQGSPVGILLALGSSLTYLFYTVLTDRNRELALLPMPVRMFFINVGAMVTCVCVGAAQPGWGSFNPMTVLCVAVCACMIAGAMLFFAKGVDRVGATSAAFFSMFEPLVSMIFSTWVYRYHLTAKVILGCVLVLFAVFFIAVSDYRERIQGEA